MSQSNSRKAKKTFYILLFFTVICVAVTFACIYNTLQMKNENHAFLENFFDDTNNSKQEKVSDTKKYLMNGIIIKNNSKKDGEIVQEYSDGYDPTYQYEFNYEQISGLKNKEIQDKINSEIRNTVFGLKSELDKHPECDRISVSSSIIANYSDVMSIDIFYALSNSPDLFNASSNSESNEEYKHVYLTGNKTLNYSLETGEQLKFTDLFWKDSNIKQIISESAYKALAWEHLYNNQDEAFWGDFDETEYGYIENKQYRIISAFNRNNDVDFYFSSDQIYVNINNLDFYINMFDYKDDIAIYTAFKSNKNLYDDTIKQKEFYAFTDIYLIDCLVKEEQVTDNFYYEFVTYNNEEETDIPEVREVVLSKIKNKLEHYQKIANENPRKAYMVSVYYNYDNMPSNSSKYYHYSGFVCETDKDYYDQNKDKILSSARRNSTGEIWAYDFSDSDDEVKFFEQFTVYADDYLDDNVEETIYTREEREKDEAEWEAERLKYEQENN